MSLNLFSLKAQHFDDAIANKFHLLVRILPAEKLVKIKEFHRCSFSFFVRNLFLQISRVRSAISPHFLYSIL